MDYKELDSIELENGVKYVWWIVYRGMNNIITKQNSPESDEEIINDVDCYSFWEGLNYALNERSFRK